MASISDVETALESLIAAQVYPNGTPPAGSSAVGSPIKVYAGWPDPQQLEVDLVETAGAPVASHVSVYPLPSERNVTRYPVDERVGTPNPKTYTLSVAGQVVSVGGAAPATYYAHNLAVLVGGYPYVYQATAGQTPAQVAAALQALIVVDFPGTTVSGAQITLPAGARLGVPVVGTEANVTREVRRQERQFQMAVWTSNPALRAQIADLIDPVLADTPFLTLADGSKARLRYVGAREDDFLQKQRIYRRLLIYTVEYATSRAETATQIVAPSVNVEDTAGDALFTTPVRP